MYKGEELQYYGLKLVVISGVVGPWQGGTLFSGRIRQWVVNVVRQQGGRVSE